MRGEEGSNERERTGKTVREAAGEKKRKRGGRERVVPGKGISVESRKLSLNFYPFIFHVS